MWQSLKQTCQAGRLICHPVHTHTRKFSHLIIIIVTGCHFKVECRALTPKERMYGRSFGLLHVHAPLAIPPLLPPTLSYVIVPLPPLSWLSHSLNPTEPVLIYEDTWTTRKGWCVMWEREQKKIGAILREKDETCDLFDCRSQSFLCVSVPQSLSLAPFNCPSTKSTSIYDFTLIIQTAELASFLSRTVCLSKKRPKVKFLLHWRVRGGWWTFFELTFHVCMCDCVCVKTDAEISENR